MWVLTLDPALEDLINNHIDRERGNANTMPPQTQQQIVKQIAEKANELTQTGRTAVVLCSPHVRSALRRMIESSLPQVAVLAFNEIASEVAVEGGGASNESAGGGGGGGGGWVGRRGCWGGRLLCPPPRARQASLLQEGAA